jgi:hypothetical protein
MSLVALLRVRRERRVERRRERRADAADRNRQGTLIPPGSGRIGYTRFFRGGGF